MTDGLCKEVEGQVGVILSRGESIQICGLKDERFVTVMAYGLSLVFRLASSAILPSCFDNVGTPARFFWG